MSKSVVGQIGLAGLERGPRNVMGLKPTLPPLAAEESMLTDERIIEADTAAMAGILCRRSRSRHPESCTKLSGLTGEAVAGRTVVPPA